MGRCESGYDGRTGHVEGAAVSQKTKYLLTWIVLINAAIIVLSYHAAGHDYAFGFTVACLLLVSMDWIWRRGP